MKTEWNGGTDYEENPKGGTVAELNGTERAILAEKCILLRELAIRKDVLRKRIIRDNAELVQSAEYSQEAINYMAECFVLSRAQVLSKVLAYHKEAAERESQRLGHFA